MLLEALGVSGNNAPGTLISLAGKLSYVTATNTLVINLAASGLTLKTDAYQLILVGSGSQVIASPQGIALDGENTDPKQLDDPNNPQLALPSGDGYPGGNFYDNFIINTTPPSVTSGHLQAGPGERHQHRRRLRHLLHAAQLRGDDHRAQPGPGAPERPDGDRRHRHRLAGNRLLRRFVEHSRHPAAVHPRERRHRP